MSAQTEPKFVEFPRPLDEEEAPKLHTTTIRFDRDLLELLTAQAKKRGISRSAYVNLAVSIAIESGL